MKNWAPVLKPRALVLAVTMLLVSAAQATDTPPEHAAARPDSMTPFTDAQFTYLERCGGCHGIQGRSAPGEVPTLRGQVNYFLCLPETRGYLIRLPSVASAPISDEALADLMNFVVFDLGGRPDARTTFGAYTANEVQALRKQPLNEISLASYRAALVERLIDQCGAPTTLREYASVRGK